MQTQYHTGFSIGKNRPELTENAWPSDVSAKDSMMKYYTDQKYSIAMQQ